MDSIMPVQVIAHSAGMVMSDFIFLEGVTPPIKRAHSIIELVYPTVKPILIFE